MNKIDQLSFKLTEEEQAAVNSYYDSLKDHRFDPKIAGQLSNALAAKALLEYAKTQISMADSDKNNRNQYTEKAVLAVGKAYTFHALPIYIFALATYIEMRSSIASAKKTYQNFLDAQSKFMPDEISSFFLRDFNSTAAIEIAKSKIASN